MHAVELADDEYFVLGDNRAGSRDSRHWGPLPADQIIGKVWAIYWPQVGLGIAGSRDSSRRDSFPSSRPSFRRSRPAQPG